MDIVLILLGVAGVLLFYQVVVKKDKDELDSRGRPVKRKNRA